MSDDLAFEIKASIDGVCGELDSIWDLIDDIARDLPDRRERIATAVLNGIVSRRSVNGPNETWAAYSESVSGLAVCVADALIAKLDKPKAQE